MSEYSKDSQFVAIAEGAPTKTTHDLTKITNKDSRFLASARGAFPEGIPPNNDSKLETEATEAQRAIIEDINRKTKAALASHDETNYPAGKRVPTEHTYT